MHAIRERRLGKVPPFVGRFLIGFGRSERKYAFSALGNTNKSTFSNFCELFAPRLLPHLNITVRNMRNLYFFLVPPNIHPTRTPAGRGQDAARGGQRISARSRANSIAKFRGRETFSKTSVRNSPRIAPNPTRHSMPTLGTVLGVAV